MGLPQKIKKNIQLVPDRQLLSRREELLEYIQKNDTYLPKSILHPDLDRGMLDFVKENLLITIEGETVNFIDTILSTQNWSQYTETWQFMNDDLNAEPPFVTVVRSPEMKYGSNPSTVYTIPNRREFYYVTVPTWDGQRKGADVYQIPQPVPIDINYSVKIMTNRMRDLNNFNRVILQKFSSRQAYATIKGHFVPIIMNNISDESQLSSDSRKFFLQSYDFTMLGFLIDESEFKIKPAISRVVQVYEPNLEKREVRQIKPEININPEFNMSFDVDIVSNEETIRYSATLEYINSDNIDSFDVYINNLYFGSNIKTINISNTDILRIEVEKFSNEISKIYFKIKNL